LQQQNMCVHMFDINKKKAKAQKKADPVDAPC
jgi:hypothetical protein